MTSDGGQVAFWQGIARPTLAAWQDTAFTDQNSFAVNPLFVNPVGVGGVLGYSSPADDGRDDDFHLQSVCGSFHGGSLAPAVSAVTGLPFLLFGVWAVDGAQSPAIDRGNPASSFSNEPQPNGGYVDLGAYGNTGQASKSSTSYVLVTKPSGGEFWPEEQTFPIRWRSQDSAGTVTIEPLATRHVGHAHCLRRAQQRPIPVDHPRFDHAGEQLRDPGEPRRSGDLRQQPCQVHDRRAAVLLLRR